MQIVSPLPRETLGAAQMPELFEAPDSKAPTPYEPCEPSEAQDTITCPTCSEAFIRNRRDQKYCSDRCRKQKYQQEDRKKNPKNAEFSRDVRLENRRQRQRARELAATLYGMSPDERLGFMKELIDAARTQDSKLRSIFTDPTLLGATKDDPWLFHRRCPGSYKTISQAGNAYCRKFWNASVCEVVKGKSPEPPSGEVMF